MMEEARDVGTGIIGQCDNEDGDTRRAKEKFSKIPAIWTREQELCTSQERTRSTYQSWSQEMIRWGRPKRIHNDWSHAWWLKHDCRAKSYSMHNHGILLTIRHDRVWNILGWSCVTGVCIKTSSLKFLRICLPVLVGWRNIMWISTWLRRDVFLLTHELYFSLLYLYICGKIVQGDSRLPLKNILTKPYSHQTAMQHDIRSWKLPGQTKEDQTPSWTLRTAVLHVFMQTPVS